MHNLTDTELVTLYQQSRNKQAVGELFKRHTGFTFAVCMKYLNNREQSSDAVMQIFEKLFDSLLKHQIQQFKPWLYTVTRNHCFQLARSAPPVVVPAQPLNLPADCPDPYDTESDTEQQLQQLHTELANLPPEQQTCINLFYLKELSYKQIAQQTGFTLNEVKSHIQNGKRRLKINMERIKK